MRRASLALALLSGGVPAVNQFPWAAHASGAYLVDAQATPVLMVAESAWNLATQLKLAEIVDYFVDRKARGFNCAVVRVLSKNSDNSPNNAYGVAPFTTPGDFSTTNEQYFALLDAVNEEAAKLGILVIWSACYSGYQAQTGDGWQAEMRTNGATKVQAFGAYLSARWAKYDNVAFLLGGDFTPGVAQAGDVTLFNALRTGLLTSKAFPITCHYAQDNTNPWGILSSDLAGSISFDWDLAYSWNTLSGQPTNGRGTAYSLVTTGIARSPRKPVFVGEDIYSQNAGQGGNAARTRQQAWDAILAGACGRVTGDEGIWPFGGTSGNLPSQATGHGDWRQYLGAATAVGVSVWAAYLRSISWWALVPDASSLTVVSGRGTLGTNTYVTAARTADGALCVAYLAAGGTISVDLTRLRGVVTAQWIDPTTGTATAIGTFNPTGTQAFTSPSTNSLGDPDFVLELVAAAAPSDSLSAPSSPRQFLAGNANLRLSPSEEPECLGFTTRSSPRSRSPRRPTSSRSLLLRRASSCRSPCGSHRRATSATRRTRSFRSPGSAGIRQPAPEARLSRRRRPITATALRDAPPRQTTRRSRPEVRRLPSRSTAGTFAPATSTFQCQTSLRS